MNASDLLKKTLPWIGAVATGGLPGLLIEAAAQVSNKIGKKVDPTLNGIADAVASATPDQLLALKQADNDFAVKMKQLGFTHEEELTTLAAGDRASARSREIAVKDNTPRNLAYIYTLGFFAVLGGEIYIGLQHVALEPGAKMTLDMLFGALLGMVLGTKEYYFGTSTGSERKTELLAASVPAKTPNAGTEAQPTGTTGP
jgi:hypothetical protein